jgi:membrane fusion protein, multidrug efflux system
MICTHHRILTLTAAAVAGLAAAGCGTKAQTQTAPAANGTGRPPVAVSVAPAVPSVLTETVDVVGTLAPKFAADVKSEVSGLVAAVEVTEWVPVRKGALLARLDTTETEAAIDALRAVEAQAGVAETRARREHERALQLERYGLVTPQALDEAKSGLDAAIAATVAARAQVRTAETRLAKSLIRAPMDGVVAERRVNVGDRVENIGGGDPLFRIVDNRLLDLTLTVPTAQMAAVRVGHAIDFTTDAHPGRTFTGRVQFINPAVDAASRSAKVIASVRNADDALRGGVFVRGRIIVGTRENVLQVPRDALLNWNVSERTADLFVVCDGVAQRRPVKTGVVSAAGVEISAGLLAGDVVVTRGGFALRHGDAVTVPNGNKGA